MPTESMPATSLTWLICAARQILEGTLQNSRWPTYHIGYRWNIWTGYEVGEEVDHHQALLGRLSKKVDRRPNMGIWNCYRQLEELVRYISRRVAQCLSRGVRENHRGDRDLQRVTGCLQKHFFGQYFNADQIITWTELWERSTIIPSRFISFITVWKVFVSKVGRITHNTIHLWTCQVLQPLWSLGGSGENKFIGNYGGSFEIIRRL